METYRDMLEKLKYHRDHIINSFINKGYYPSSEEINDQLKLVNSRIALFETYFSKPGSYMNIKELNYCFEMIANDITILYKVLEDILSNEFAALNVFIESSLSELESKAEHYRKRCTEEIHSTTLGTTVFFKANQWNIIEEDETNVIFLGAMDLIEGMDIACFIDLVDDALTDELDMIFHFENNDPTKSFYALPYNYNNNSYRVPGHIDINEYPFSLPNNAILDDYIPLKLANAEINFENKYKIAGAMGGMQVTSKATGETFLYTFANMDNAFVAEEDCYVEFYVLDGNVNAESHLEYYFTEQPLATNFSLQDGKIPLKTDAVKVFIECQKGLGMFFIIPTGTVYSAYEDVIIVNKNTFLYKGNWNVRDFVVREYVRTRKTSYRVKVYIKSKIDIVSELESVYIKEVTP